MRFNFNCDSPSNKAKDGKWSGTEVWGKKERGEKREEVNTDMQEGASGMDVEVDD